jgi:hypothetical protein
MNNLLNYRSNNFIDLFHQFIRYQFINFDYLNLNFNLSDKVLKDHMEPINNFF